jgi:nucleoside-diphosphate-sugar epimerase
MKALVTGHKGFIGRHITEALEDCSYRVTGVDLAGGESKFATISAQADMRDYLAAPNDSSHEDWDLIVHCAAFEPHRAAIDGTPAHVLTQNLSLDAELFRYALAHRPGRVVYLSSSAAYPMLLQQHQNRLLLREEYMDYAYGPDGVYGWAKVTGEKLAEKAREDGIDVTVVRPFSGYGTDQSQDFPFGAFVARAKRREDPFKIWGNGEQVRDWVHVDDIVGAILALIAKPVTDPVNIGCGIGTSLNDLARMICFEAGYHPTFQHDYKAPVGAEYRVCSPMQLQQTYVPTISLPEGISLAFH